MNIAVSGWHCAAMNDRIVSSEREGCGTKWPAVSGWHCAAMNDRIVSSEREGCGTKWPRPDLSYCPGSCLG